MSGTIRISTAESWEGGLFYDILEFWQTHALSDPELRDEIAIGLCGIKYCDLSEIKLNTLKELRKLLHQYRAQLPEKSKSWPRPEILPGGIKQVDDLLARLDRRIRQLELSNENH